MNIEKMKAKKIPKAPKIWWKLVRVPEIYGGDVYFMIMGPRVLQKPATIPWSRRATTKD